MMKRREGQFTIEFVLFIAIIVIALYGCQRMLKAALMGRWRSVADSYGFGRQFEPKRTSVSP